MSEAKGHEEETTWRYSFKNTMTEEKKKSCCLIINIDETEKKIDGTRVVKKIRTGAGREVEKLKSTFTSDRYDTHVMEMEMEEKKKDVSVHVKDYIENVTKGNDDEGKKLAGNLKTSDVFICFLLAFGGPGFFYDRKGNKISLSAIITQFKSCPDLLEKPKLFIIQTCDLNLRPVGKHLFRDEDQDISEPHCWPQDADILIYESNISGEYDWNPGLRKNKQGKRTSFPSLQCGTFIKTFCKAFKASENNTEFGDVIMRTNLMLQKFVENRHFWDLQDETWSSAPKLPIVTDQLCKELRFPNYK
nr:caspase-7-like isoform X3 [Crassostrea virginica]